MGLLILLIYDFIQSRVYIKVTLNAFNGKKYWKYFCRWGILCRWLPYKTIIRHFIGSLLECGFLPTPTAHTNGPRPKNFVGIRYLRYLRRVNKTAWKLCETHCREHTNIASQGCIRVYIFSYPADPAWIPKHRDVLVQIQWRILMRGLHLSLRDSPNDNLYSQFAQGRIVLLLLLWFLEVWLVRRRCLESVNPVPTMRRWI